MGTCTYVISCLFACALHLVVWFYLSIKCYYVTLVRTFVRYLPKISYKNCWFAYTHNACPWTCAYVHTRLCQKYLTKIVGSSGTWIRMRVYEYLRIMRIREPVHIRRHTHTRSLRLKPTKISDKNCWFQCALDSSARPYTCDRVRSRIRTCICVPVPVRIGSSKISYIFC